MTAVSQALPVPAACDPPNSRQVGTHLRGEGALASLKVAGLALGALSPAAWALPAPGAVTPNQGRGRPGGPYGDVPLSPEREGDDLPGGPNSSALKPSTRCPSGIGGAS